MSAGSTGGHVELVDTTTRDGNQSLWSATGLTTSDLVAIAPTMDRVGFHAVDFTSSTHMAVAVRFHHEDPWERLRLVSAAMPTTPLSFITSGMRFITWVPVDEDVMRLAFRCVVRNGIRRVQVADPSNDPGRLRRVAVVAREEGVDEIAIALTYSVSAVHTHAYYAERAAALADCAEMDRLYLKDPGGLVTVDAVRELAPHFLRAAGERPIELHSHCTIGLAPFVYMEGLRAGFRVLHTAVEPLARGTSNPAAETTLRNLEAGGSPTGSTSTPSARSPGTSATSLARRDCRSAPPKSTTPPTTTTSLPGGWSRPPGECSRSCGDPSCSTPRSKRSVSCVPRWGIRSS